MPNSSAGNTCVVVFLNFDISLDKVDQDKTVNVFSN